MRTSVSSGAIMHSPVGAALWQRLKGYIETGEARVAVVDETLIKVGGSYYWLWLAIEPERRKILFMALTQARNALIAPSILKELRRRYGK